MRDLLYFDKMITPKFITFLYWLMLFVAIVGGLGTMIKASFFGGLLGLVVGVIGARIWCELLIVLFKMNDALQELRNK